MSMESSHPFALLKTILPENSCWKIQKVKTKLNTAPAAVVTLCLIFPMKTLLGKRYSLGLAVKFNDNTLANPRGLIGLNILQALSALELGCSLAMGCVSFTMSCEHPAACFNQGLLLPWPQGGRWVTVAAFLTSLLK